jgi:hypothetical protein
MPIEDGSINHLGLNEQITLRREGGKDEEGIIYRHFLVAYGRNTLPRDWNCGLLLRMVNNSADRQTLLCYWRHSVHWRQVNIQ